MLDRYFHKPDTVDRIRNCWLGEAIERYVTQLVEPAITADQRYKETPADVADAALHLTLGLGAIGSAQSRHERVVMGEILEAWVESMQSTAISVALLNHRTHVVVVMWPPRLCCR